MRKRTVVVALDGLRRDMVGGRRRRSPSVRRGGDPFRRASLGLPVRHQRDLHLLRDRLARHELVLIYLDRNEDATAVLVLRSCPRVGAVLESEALTTVGAGGREWPALRRFHAERRPTERIRRAGDSAAGKPFAVGPARLRPVWWSWRLAADAFPDDRGQRLLVGRRAECVHLCDRSRPQDPAVNWVFRPMAARDGGCNGGSAS
jgi:hypothetical protein